METKICKKCGQEKPLDEFPKHRGYKDGRQSFCRECRNLYSKSYYRTIGKEDRKKKTDLAKYTTRDLLLELKRRGCTGTFTMTEVYNLEAL
jgi:hypothetical protein